MRRAATRRSYGRKLRRRHFEEGETIPRLAQATGIPFATVKCICSAKERERAPRLF